MNDMTKMVGQMMTMPFTMFTSTMEAFGRSMTGGGWMGDTAKAVACAPCEMAKPMVEAVTETVRDDREWECSDRCGEGLACPPERYDHGWARAERRERRDEWCGRCGSRSCDCCCGSDRGSDLVKLVEYSLVTVRRGDRSRVLEGPRQILVSDCTDLEELRNEIIVDYVQEHQGKPIDGKHLRVYTRVLACWCKDDVDWCEEQVDALQSIARSLRRDDREERRAS